MNQLMFHLRKRTKRHLLRWLQAFLIVSLLLSPATGALAQDAGDESPVPQAEEPVLQAEEVVTPDEASAPSVDGIDQVDAPTEPAAVTSPEVMPGLVELTGPPAQQLQPIDPAAVEEQVKRLYLPMIAQDEMKASAVQAAKSLDMRLLVIAADGKETDYPVIRSTLDQLGIPYTVLLSATQPLTASMLSNGVDRGYYQGVILVTGNLSYFNTATQQWESGLDWTEWNTLWQYEAAFGVRQVTSYTYPGGWPDSYGLNLVTYRDTTSQPLTAQFTAAGKQVYADLNTNNPVTFKNTWVYLGTIVNTAVTTPLLTTSEGYAIASIHTYPDGRQNLAITAANNPYLLHSLQLSYGTINWLTKGLFLGYRKVWINPQVDDLLIESDMWDIAAQTDTSGLLFRLSGDDIAKAVAWQNRIRTTFPFASSLTLEWAFNGVGSSGITPDTLTPAVRQHRSAFTFVNHTFNHANLDSINYAQTRTELQQNHLTATLLGLTRYYKDTLVQPDISGLYNAEMQRAAKDFGIKYLISDTSRPGWNNPSPNAGFVSVYQPSILIIPRRPTNLFYNLSTPAEWVSEYNCFYGPTGICAGGQFRYWDRNLTYAEILDKESDMMLQYLLKWDIDPLMFHQANMRAYDGTNSLLGDLINRTLQKYSQVYVLPIRFLTQHDIGLQMTQRMAYNASGVTATLIPCQSITLRTTKQARIPITGIAYGTTANREVYGGQNISYVTLNANTPLVLPVPACN